MKLIPKKKTNNRYNLDTCYAFGNYNKAVKYGKSHNAVDGVSNCMEKLDSEKNSYINEMQNIIDNEKENENKKYSLWEKCSNIKYKSSITTMISFILMLLNMIILGRGNSFLYEALFILLPLVFTFSIFTAVLSTFAELITNNRYFDYTLTLDGKLQKQNRLFENISYNIYQDIDNLYLNSLDPVHKETVLMHRKQDEHNRRMAQLAEDQHRLATQNLNETRRANEMQARLLQLEEKKEEERRYNKW